MSARPRPRKMGHLVLMVRDIQASARFYNEVVVRRQVESARASGGKISKADELISFVDGIFGEFRTAFGDNCSFALVVVQRGFALAAQFLHEEKGMTDSECRQCIISTLASFIRSAEHKDKAIEYVRLAPKTTHEHRNILRKESCIWFEWEEKTKDLIDMAIQESEKDVK